MGSAIGRGGRRSKQEFVILGYDDFGLEDQIMRETSSACFTDYKDERRPTPNSENMCCFWSEDDFLIIAKPVMETKLKALHDALVNLNAVIMTNGKDNPFGGSGLLILIRDRIDQSVLDMWRDFDKSHDTLQRIARQCGIERDLKAAKKQFFFLTPRWTRDAPENLNKRKAEHITFWLNTQLKSDNSGYYTVDELRQWLDNKGPIPKKNDE